MQANWQAFLKQAGELIQDNDVIDFSNSDINLSGTPLVVPLSGFAMLAVSGNDRHEFLHGQFINDLNFIENNAAQISGWCNSKGQLITNFIIINTGIAYLLIFKEDLKEFVQKRLLMFVMRSNVFINDISDSSPLVGLANCNVLISSMKNSPTSPGEINIFDDQIIICHPDGSGRHLITGNIVELINNISKFKKSMPMSRSSLWNILDILAGLPWVTTLTKEQYLPQMLNIDVINGLSYQKGCYPGQEVIARLHYRGEVKKRVSLIQSKHLLSIGEQLISEPSNNKAGAIINSAMHPNGLCYALAVIMLDKLNDKLIINNQQITIVDLPYDIN
jgi:folate-binding protein YgfZ